MSSSSDPVVGSLFVSWLSSSQFWLSKVLLSSCRVFAELALCVPVLLFRLSLWPLCDVVSIHAPAESSVIFVPLSLSHRLVPLSSRLALIVSSPLLYCWISSGLTWVLLSIDFDYLGISTWTVILQQHHHFLFIKARQTSPKGGDTVTIQAPRSPTHYIF